MTLHNLGGFNVLKKGKSVKDFTDFVTNFVSGDTLMIHKKTIDSDNVFRLDNQTLYVEGTNADTPTLIRVPRHTALFQVSGNSKLTIKNVKIVIKPQANIINLSDDFTGELILENTEFIFDKTEKHTPNHEYYPLVLSNAVANGNIQIDNSFLEQANLSGETIFLTGTTIGHHLTPQSSIDFNKISVDKGCCFTNCSIHNNLPEEPIYLDELKTAGGLSIGGKITINQLLIVEDLLLKKELNKPAPFKLIKSRSTSQLVSEQLSSWYEKIGFPCLPILFSSPSRISSNEVIQIKNISLTESFLSFINNPTYDLTFPITFFYLDTPASWHIQQTTLADYDWLGTSMLLNQCRLTLENVKDELRWHDDKTTTTIFSGKTKSIYLKATNAVEENVKNEQGEFESRILTAEEQLYNLTGLTSVKEQMTQLIALAKMNVERKKRGLPTNTNLSLHMVFSGNAGTGKTTVARLFGQALYEKGILPKVTFIEATRKDLVGRYVGETAPKTHEIIEKARGGVLFIDEAYALSQKGTNDFANEAVDQLIADMENYRNDLVVILAGYTKDMTEFFSTGNQGLKSRFANWIEFPNYSSEELLEILDYQLNKQSIYVPTELMNELRTHFHDQYQSENASDIAGNGRFVRNYVEKLIMLKDTRLASLSDFSQLTDQDLLTITREDLDRFSHRLRS